MKKVLIAIALLSLFSCKNEDREKELLQRENEVLKKEKEILEQENATNAYNNESAAAPDPAAPVQEEFYADGEGDYPQGSTRLLDHSDLQNLTMKEIRILKNEIFARHGYIFKNKELANHFNAQPWYSAMYSDVSGLLSKTEQQNVDFIHKNYE